jgi:hypothetical protein
LVLPRSFDFQLEEMMADRYRVIQAYISPYPDSIQFLKGEVVQVIKEFSDDPDWVGWFWCEGKHDNAAWIPKQFLRIQPGYAILNRTYDAKELSVEVGDVLNVTETINGFCMATNEAGIQGWVPLKHLLPSD